MIDKLTPLFQKLEAFKALRFDNMNLLGRISYPNGDVYDAQAEYDRFSAKQIRLHERHFKISNNNDPLIIAVVGSFNTGKSSLINSLIGSEFLVMADKSATRKITMFTYKNADTFTIFQYKQNGKAHEISYEEYLEAAAHQYGVPLAQETADQIDYFQVDYPCDFIRDFQIVDTPGFSSMSVHDDRITKDYLDKADLLLWTFDATKGAINAMELELLRSIHNKRVIAIINRIDNLPPSQRQLVIDRISHEYPFHCVIPYSASSVLAYRLDVSYNEYIMSQAYKKIGECLGVEDNLIIKREGEHFILSKSDRIIYEQKIRLINNDDFVLQYHSFVDLLKQIRAEITSIKLEQFVKELSEFYAEECDFWKKTVEYVEQLMEMQISEQHLMEEFLTSVKELIESRSSVYFDDLQEQLNNSIFNILYSIDYQSAGFFEGEKYFLKPKLDTDERRQILFNLISTEFNSFYNKLAADYTTCLTKFDIDVHENEWFEFSRVLKDSFVQMSFNSVLGSYLLVVEFQLGQNESETRKIFNGALELLMSHHEMKSFSTAFFNYIIEDLVEKRQNIIKQFYDSLSNFKDIVIDVLDE